MASKPTALHDVTPRPLTLSLNEAALRVARLGTKPITAAFLARGLNALAGLVELLEETELSDATGASSDLEVLLRALEHDAALEELRGSDPLAGARLRGLKLRADLLNSEGGTLSVERVAALLRISRQAVDKRRRAGRLLALRLGRRGYAYPAWQFGDAGVIDGFERALKSLAEHDPWRQCAFFLSGHSRLQGKTALTALREGAVDAVCNAASLYGKHGAV